MAERGKYIVIEGHDGTGKSTQVELLRERLARDGIESIEFHEPEDKDIPITTSIRALIKDAGQDRLPETNLLLFTAARHEIWKRARAELQLGKWVVASRNYFSTLAYQGYGEGLDLDLIVNTTRQFTDELYMDPDTAVVLSLDDAQERAKRIGKRGELETPDTFESRGSDFQQSVQQAYLTIAKERDLPVISANQPVEAILAEIYTHIK